MARPNPTAVVQYRILLCLFVLCSFGFSVQAQVFPELKFAPRYQSFNLNDLNTLTLNNTLPNALSVTLQIEVSEADKGKLLQIVTLPFTVQPGSNSIGNLLSNGNSVQFFNSSFSSRIKNDQPLDNGAYYICATVLDAAQEGELGRNCAQLVLSGAPTVTDTTQVPVSNNKKQKKQNIRLSGTSDLLVNLSNGWGQTSSLPANYYRWDIRPTISLWDVPVGANILFSSLDNSQTQNVNRYQVYFDANAFQNMLKERLMKYLANNEQLSKATEFKDKYSVSQYSDVKNILSNPGVADELKKIAQLDSLKGLQNGYMEKLGKLGLDSSLLEKIKNSDSLQTFFSDSGSVASLISGTADSLSGNKIDSAKHLPDSGIVYVDSLQNKYRPKIDSLKNKGETLYNRVTHFNTDSLQNYLSDLDSLKKKIKALEWVEKKKEMYDQLMQKKDELGNYLQSKGIMDSTGTIDADKIKGTLENEVDPSKLSDMNYLQGKLSKFRLLKKYEKVLAAVRTFSIGTSNPVWSELSVSGVPIDGFLVELQPYNTYVTFAKGTLRNVTTSMDPLQLSYTRSFTGGGFGYGQKDKSHIHFHLFSSSDDPLSLPQPDSGQVTHTPKSNYVISMNFQVNLLKDRLKISGELAGSQTVRDLNYVPDTNSINPAPPGNSGDWFGNIFRQQPVDMNTTVDYAFTGKVESFLFNQRTKISVSTRRVGYNFQSFGLPFLMKDQQMIEGRWSQKFWKNRVSSTVYYRYRFDNLSGQKPVTTSQHNIGFDVSVKIPKWPLLRASLTPISQSNDSVSIDMTLFNFSANYGYTVKKVRNMEYFVYMFQTAGGTDSLMGFQNHILSLNHITTFANSASVNLTAAYYNTYTDLKGRIHSLALNAGGSYTVLKIWTHAAGGNIFFNRDEMRWGFYYQSSVPFLKFFNLTARIEKNTYTSYILPVPVPDVNLDQVVFRCMLNVKW